jgi:hypothetical protein
MRSWAGALTVKNLTKKAKNAKTEMFDFCPKDND